MLRILQQLVVRSKNETKQKTTKANDDSDVTGSVSGAAVHLLIFTVWLERHQSLGSLGWQWFYYLWRGVCTAGSRSKAVGSDPIPDRQQLSDWAKYLPLVWVSHGCYNKWPQTGWFKTTEMYSLTVQEARSPNSRCWQGQAPSKGSKGGSSLAALKTLLKTNTKDANQRLKPGYDRITT